ncbi:MAG TPA: DUF932 domain-containing protein [Kineosporiaceae bacterium]
MSRETLDHLNTQTLIGFTSSRGRAWHYRADMQGTEPNHYEGAVPVADVERRLFGWAATARRVAVEIPADIDTMTHLDADGQPMRWDVQDDRQAMTRSDNGHVMGLFSTGYEPHQYREWLLGTVSTILGDTLAIGSAGLLRGGAVAWVSVEVPDTITTPEGVAFRPNLLACTSFDGSLATTYKRVCTNVVCDNTMAVGLAEQGQTYRVKHSKYSGLKLAEARDALKIVHATADEFAAQVAQLCATTVTNRQWAAFLEEVAPLAKDDGTKLSARVAGDGREEARRPVPPVELRRPGVPLARHRLGCPSGGQHLAPPLPDRTWRDPRRPEHDPRRHRRDHPHRRRHHHHPRTRPDHLLTARPGGHHHRWWPRAPARPPTPARPGGTQNDHQCRLRHPPLVRRPHRPEPGPVPCGRGHHLRLSLGPGRPRRGQHDPWGRGVPRERHPPRDHREGRPGSNRGGREGEPWTTRPRQHPGT